MIIYSDYFGKNLKEEEMELMNISDVFVEENTDNEPVTNFSYDIKNGCVWQKN